MNTIGPYIAYIMMLLSGIAFIAAGFCGIRMMLEDMSKNGWLSKRSGDERQPSTGRKIAVVTLNDICESCGVPIVGSTCRTCTGKT